MPRSPPALRGRDARVHYHDMKRVYHSPAWTLRDLGRVFADWRLWPLLVMYFGVVGVGVGVQLYANLIIQAINPTLSGVELSLLTAPIWIVCSISISSLLTSPSLLHLVVTNTANTSNQMDLIAILLVTPLSRPLPPTPSNLLLPPSPPPNPRPPPNELRRERRQPVATLRRPPNRRLRARPHSANNNDMDDRNLPTAARRGRRCGCVGCCVWIGQPGIHPDYVCASSGWKSDYEAPGREKYRKSNLVMVGILIGSILSAVLMEVLLSFVDGRYKDNAEVVDGAGRGRIGRGMQGLGKRFKRFGLRTGGSE